MSSSLQIQPMRTLALSLLVLMGVGALHAPTTVAAPLRAEKRVGDPTVRNPANSTTKATRPAKLLGVPAVPATRSTVVPDKSGAKKLASTPTVAAAASAAAGAAAAHPAPIAQLLTPTNPPTPGTITPAAPGTSTAPRPATPQSARPPLPRAFSTDPPTGMPPPSSPLLLTPNASDLQQPRLPGAPASAPPSGAVTLEEVIRTALARYPSIDGARANRDSAHFDVQAARAGHFPTVSVNSQRRIVGAANNLTQPQLNVNLYASGAIEAGVEREKWREHSLTSAVTATREDVAFESAAAWFRLYRGTIVQAANLRNLERHLRLVDDFAAIASIDTGRRYDLIQARSRTEQVRQTATAGEAEIATARAILARFYPQPVNIAAFAPPPELADPPLPSDDVIALHPNVESARRSLLSAEANARATRAARGPRLDLAATAGAYSSTVVQFSWPAFDLARSAAEDSAGAALVGARALVQEQELIVRERQQTAFQAWRAAMDREKVAVGQVAASNELVDVYRQQFQIGRRNLLDLLNAFAELYSAEASRDAARVDRAASRYQLEYAAGRLSTLFDRPSDGASLRK